MLVRSGAVDVVAIDSVAALTPRAELEGQMGDQTVGVQARMMSQAMRKLAGNLNRTQTLCLFVNQIREKVGVMFGSPETQPGGRALKFYSSQRLDIRRIETLKDGTEAVGNRVRVKVVKNKVAAPFRQAEFDIEFGKGISTSGCILDLAIEHNVVAKSGSFFSYGDERLGQGRNNAKAYLDEHVEVAKEIEAKIYAALGHRAGPRDPDRPRAGRRRGGRGRRPTAAVEAARRDAAARPRLIAVADAVVRPPLVARRGARHARSAPAGERRGDPEERARARARRRLARAEPARPHRARAARHPRREARRARGGRASCSTSCSTAASSTTPRFAQRFADDRRRLDAWGSERIERRLRELGVAPEHDRRGGRASRTHEDELEAALALLRRRVPARARRRRASATARSACSSARATSSSSPTTRCAATRAPTSRWTERRRRRHALLAPGHCVRRLVVLRSRPATDRAVGPLKLQQNSHFQRTPASSAVTAIHPPTPGQRPGQTLRTHHLAAL